MKTYFFIILIFCGVCGQSFAAQDDTFVQMTQSHIAFYSLTVNQLNVSENEQATELSWKTKIALKVAKQKIAKAERRAKKGKAGGLLGGLLAFIIVGAILIPLGALILLPLLIIGVILLAFGIVGAVLRGVGQLFWW